MKPKGLVRLFDELWAAALNDSLLDYDGNATTSITVKEFRRRVAELETIRAEASVLINDALKWGCDGREHYARWWEPDQKRYRKLKERAAEFSRETK